MRLADELTVAQHMLAHDGYGHFSYLRLVRLVDRSIPDSIGFRQRCSDIVAALVVLIEKGRDPPSPPRPRRVA
jgi:hypothetical protein